MVQEWITVGDLVEGAFTVQMPQGWHNEARTVRVNGTPRPLLTATRPDGGAFLFSGDANLSTFTEPAAMPYGMMLPNVQPYAPADAFFAWYVRERYGRMPNFRVTDMTRDVAAEQKAYSNAQMSGMNLQVTAVIVSFEYNDNGATIRARLRGNTVSLGSIWIPDVSGVMTNSGDPAPLDALLSYMIESYRTNAQWRQTQDQFHAQTMAQNAQFHQNTMATMQTGHQARMDAIAQSGAANTARHNDRMAQSTVNHQQFMQTLHQPSPASVSAQSGGDPSHERFVNYINDQETVVDAGGDTYKVETGSERYFVNKNDGTYIATDAFTEQADLRSRYGVNPDDYTQTQIRR